jgi:hypothetical protein
VSSNTGIGVNNGGSGSSLTVSGGTMKSISGYAITNSGNGNTVTVTGGTSVLNVVAVAEASVVFDDHASPWHTLCSVEGPDRPGLLSAITTG